MSMPLAKHTSHVTRNTEDDILETALEYQSENEESMNSYYQTSDDDRRIINYSGSYQYIIVMSSFLMLFMSFGISNSWGIFQDYFDQNNVFSENGEKIQHSQLRLSFVGTLSLFFEHSMAPLAEWIRSVRGMSLLYLTQSILFGGGSAFLCSMILTVVPQYFHRYQGFALGLVNGGSNVGNLVMPLLIAHINNHLGIAWTYRILASICLVVDILGCLIIKERLGQSPRKERKLPCSKNTKLRLDVFRNKNFCIWCLCAVTQVAAYFVPLFIIPTYATYIGLSDIEGSSLVSITSGTAFLGRVSSGLLGDRIGPINISIIFTAIAGLSSLLIWPFAYTYDALIAFMAIFGYTSGCYYSLGSPIVATLLKKEQFSSGVTIVLLLNGIAVFGPSLASAINSTGVANEPFFTFKMFTGVGTLLSAFVTIWLKFSIDQSFFAKV
ncbi:major facilitator superfamily domain-containing protein [Phascolomyces articulosus]|uniref:Major facilitator superfamily domain-containing protein n=1 Tax=Phascolomyces articulosus TaxID=60185 RepID=A0AAD5JQM5_9FUNG|nr:major facilitator superfamily domain-containing protein [Phascolomyces articulosus]